jgi:import receptor subunit TOM70
MINRALAIFQWKQDFAQAEQICREAIAIVRRLVSYTPDETGSLIDDEREQDPACDVGVATLAQLLLQQNKVHDAVGMFERSAELARTEPELVNALTFENATRAQIAFINNYPTYAEKYARFPFSAFRSAPDLEPKIGIE